MKPVIVIKYGGNAMSDSAADRCFAREVLSIQSAGFTPLIVHGGGPHINYWLSRLGKKPVFIEGMRVTDEETMAIVEMVLSGHVNKALVSAFNQVGAKAIGLSGKDAYIIRAKPYQGHVTLGQVGEVSAIAPEPIRTLLENQFIPIIAPIGVGTAGQSFNINADSVASHLAQVFSAEMLLLLTNTPGVLDAQGRLIAKLELHMIEQMLAQGTIHGGMIPKLTAARQALQHGVKAVRIIDGRGQQALVQQVLSKASLGTALCCEA